VLGILSGAEKSIELGFTVHFVGRKKESAVAAFVKSSFVPLQMSKILQDCLN